MDKAQDEKLGKLIRGARKSRGFSAEALGARLSPSVTANTVTAWERGQNRPRVEYVRQISEILEIDVRSFFPEQSPSHELIALNKDVDGLEELNENYRKMSEKQRKAVLAVASAMVE